MKYLLLILLSILIVGCDSKPKDTEYSIEVTYIDKSIDTIVAIGAKNCTITLSLDPALHNLWVDDNKVAVEVKSFNILNVKHITK